MDQDNGNGKLAYESGDAINPILDDVTAEAQFAGHFGSGSQDSPERRLMLAMLSDAIACVRQAKWSKDSAEALDWILEDEKDASGRLCSFENVCDTLGLEPSSVRRKVLERLAWSSSVPIPVLSRTKKKIIPIRVAA